MPATLEITDGTDTVSLIQDGGNTFFLNDWMPRIALPKGGGVYQQSALSDGRRLVDRRFDSVSESFDMKGQTGDMDAMARELQVLRALLEKAVAYWTTDWQSTPVYFVCQAECETNARYALIMNYSTPNDENPFSQPWLAAEGTVLDSWTLTIERDHWTENAPGTGTAVAISAVEAYNAKNYGNVDSTGAREPTTNDEVYVANTQNAANITHIYIDDGGVWSGNLLGSGVPYDLLPATPAQNDAVYFGINSALANSGPFYSLVFDLSVAQNDCELVWEYWNGAAWAAIPGTNLQDNTDTAEPFDTTGVNSVHWTQNIGGATRDISNDGGPAVTGYWVRARIDAAVGAAPSPPTQQNRDVYAITWGHVQVLSSQVGGTIPALAKIRAINQMGGISQPGNRSSHRVIVGLRSLTRGDDFSAYINISDEQTPTGITVTAVGGGSSSFVDNDVASTFRVARYSPVGAAGLTDEVEIAFSDAISREYYGTYHVFMRVDQTGGSAGDFAVQLEIDFGARYLTDTVSNESLSDAEVLDFGQQVLGVPSKIRSDEYVLDPTITIRASNSNASPGDLDFVDLILIPIDEFAVDANYTENRLSVDDYLDIDSITYPRSYIRSILRDTETISGSEVEGIIETWRTVANSQAILQANVDQRLWFFHLLDSESGYYTAPLKIASSVQVQRNQRYFSYRGDQ